MNYETVSDFSDMFAVSELKDTVYRFVFFNTFSRACYAIQIDKKLFDATFKTRHIIDERPAAIKPPKQPEGISI